MIFRCGWSNEWAVDSLQHVHGTSFDQVTHALNFYINLKSTMIVIGFESVSDTVEVKNFVFNCPPLAAKHNEELKTRNGLDNTHSPNLE